MPKNMRSHGCSILSRLFSFRRHPSADKFPTKNWTVSNEHKIDPLQCGGKRCETVASQGTNSADSHSTNTDTFHDYNACHKQDMLSFIFGGTKEYLASLVEHTLSSWTFLDESALPHLGWALGVGLVVTISAPVLRICLQLGGAYLFSSVSVLSTAFKFGGHMATLKFMDQYIGEPETAVDTLTILQTMATTDDHVRRLIVEMGGIETTVKALKQYSEDYDGVARGGCGVLMSVCGVDGVGDVIQGCGGIAAIVQAMKFWPDDERVQSYACTALNQLATGPNDNMRKKIIDVGGLVAIAEARTKHQNDSSVRIPAEHALVTLLSVDIKIQPASLSYKA